MRKLMKKMQKQEQQANPSEARKAYVCEQLDELFDFHNLEKSKNEGFYKDLLEWKSKI